MLLVIESQSAQIGIKTQNAVVNRQTSLAKNSLKTEAPKLEIESTLPQIQIDQSQCFSESGLKNVFELTSENAAMSVQLMYQSIGRVAEQGNELTNIQNGGNTIAEQANYNAYGQFEKEFGMVTMPRSRPKISVREGTTTVNVTKGTVNNNLLEGKINSEYNPGKVNIYLIQERNLKMRFEPSQLDLKG